MPVEARNGFPTIPAILWDVTGDWCPQYPPGVAADVDGMGNPTHRPFPVAPDDGEELGLKRIYWDNHKAGSS